MKRKLRHPQKLVSSPLPPPTSTPTSCRAIGELYKQTWQVFFKLVRPKKNKNRYFGKMIEGRGIYSDASKQHTLYLIFEIEPTSKKLGYDLFMEKYYVNKKDLTESAFRDYRRAYNFLIKLRDTRLRDRLKDLSVSVLLQFIPLLDKLNHSVALLENIEDKIPIWYEPDKKLIELYQALLSDKEITVEKMKKLVFDIIGPKPNSSIVKGTHSK